MRCVPHKRATRKRCAHTAAPCCAGALTHHARLLGASSLCCARTQDDAGAKTVRLCLDTRVHGVASLAFAEAAAFQGAALLAFNDAVFTEADFKSISTIGDSVKKEQVGKTGRFG
jgi:hypothetical protein